MRAVTGTLTDALKERNINFSQNISTASLSTFRIGGAARLIVYPECLFELIEAVSLCRTFRADYFVIGCGSNILFDDGEIDAVLISTRRLDAVRVEGERIRALCGARLSRLSRLAAEKGLSGLSFAAGIPGTLGGAILMNAGAFGGEIGSRVKNVLAYLPQEKKTRRFSREEAKFAYRSSIFQSNNAVILSAEFSLDKGERDEILAEMAEYARRRRATQPKEPSAGSVFRRPDPAYPLSRTLDELGVKGWREGDAAVSEKHAGFIVNKGNATARDVKKLIERMQNLTEREKGFRPQKEIRFIPREK